jgi:hypothetical protein
MEKPMSLTFRTHLSGESAAYGGFVDAIGGIATVVLSIFGLAGTRPGTMIAIAIIVFGVSLLIQGGTMATEYAGIRFPAGAVAPSGGNSLSAIFMVGAAGIILGVLALLGLESVVLDAVAIIVFGAGLALSSSSLAHLHAMKRWGAASEAEPTLAGSEILASEMAYGSGGLQALAGLAAVVLGILAISGTGIVDDRILILAGLLVVGATMVVTGSAMTGTMARPTTPPRTTPRM